MGRASSRSKRLWSLALAVVLTGVAGPAIAEDPELAASEPRRVDEPRASESSKPPTARDAQSDPGVEPVPRAPESATASDVDKAPLPHEAGGILIERRRGYRWRWLPRALLYVPRKLLEMPLTGARYGVYYYDRYKVKDRLTQLFFNDDETIGLYPTAFFETGFGLNAGARFVWRDMFDKEASIHARAGYGGPYRQVFEAKLHSGTLFGDRLELSNEFEYRVRPSSRFFGFGNGDVVAFENSPPAAGTLIDPTMDDTAIATRYVHENIRAEIITEAALTRSLSLRTTAGFRHSTFGGDTQVKRDSDLEMAYDTNSLIGYVDGIDSLYFELEAGFDTRRPAYHYRPEPVPARGTRMNAWVGYQNGLGDNDPSRFVRFGAEAEQYFDLWHGNRILSLRARMEGVLGDFDQIPFIDLPTLGGQYVLRGYPRGRFRDRYSGVVTAEYSYPVQRLATGYLFVDAGRVWRQFDELDLSDNRVGFGAGLQFHTLSSFIGRLSIASSIDGGVEFYLTLDPVFGSRKRAEAPR